MNKFKHQLGKHQLGLSLVEVLVALVISLFLLTGLGQAYLSNRVSYTFSEAISRIQENGRFALDTAIGTGATGTNCGTDPATDLTCFSATMIQ